MSPSGEEARQPQYALKGSPAAWGPDINEAQNLLRCDGVFLGVCQLCGVLVVMKKKKTKRKKDRKSLSSGDFPHLPFPEAT